MSNTKPQNPPGSTVTLPNGKQVFYGLTGDERYLNQAGEYVKTALFKYATQGITPPAPITPTVTTGFQNPTGWFTADAGAVNNLNVRWIQQGAIWSIIVTFTVTGSIPANTPATFAAPAGLAFNTNGPYSATGVIERRGASAAYGDMGGGDFLWDPTAATGSAFDTPTVSCTSGSNLFVVGNTYVITFNGIAA